VCAYQTVLHAFTERVTGVRDHHAGTEPAALFQNAVLRQENPSVQPNTVGDLHMMLDNAVRADADVIADGVFLTDDDVMPGLQPYANGVARVNHGMRTNHAACADDQRQIAGLLSTRRLA